jgi:phosphatidylinositol alpha-1,6-mannosyltransferase
MRNGDSCWDPRHSFPEGQWDECISVFGKVTVLARTLQTDAPPGRPAFPKEVSVAELPYYIGPVQAARNFFPLNRIARQRARGSELFILRVPGILPSIVWYWLRRFRRPYAVEVLGDPNEVFQVVRHPLRRLWRLLYTSAQTRMVRGACASLFISRTLAERYPPPPGCVSAIISDVRLTETVFSSPRVYAKSPDPFRLVHVGNMEQSYKGHEYLLKAVAICKEQGLPVRLELVGEGRLRPYFEQVSANLGVKDVVTFRGAVSWGTALFDILDEAHLFVMPSLTEGLGKALLEAMARGLPAVGSDVGGIPELLPKEVLVPPGRETPLAEKILFFARQPNELSRQSARNFREAQNYKNRALSEKRKKFYQQFLSIAENRNAPGAGGLDPEPDMVASGLASYAHQNRGG